MPGHLSPAGGLTQARVRVAGGGAQPWWRGRGGLAILYRMFWEILLTPG